MEPNATRLANRILELEAEVAQLRRAEALGDVATALFGELRSLMAPVSAGTEVLARKLSHEEPLGMTAKHVATASAFAARLLRETLDFVHQPPPEQQSSVLVDVISRMRGLFDSLLGGLTLHLELNSALNVLVLTDRLTPERALLNLVCNGLDTAGTNGGFTLTAAPVSITPDEARKCGCPMPGEYVALRVSGRRGAERTDFLHRSPLGASGAANGPRTALTTLTNMVRDRGWGMATSAGAEPLQTVCVYLPRSLS